MFRLTCRGWQHLLHTSHAEQASVDDLRTPSPAVFAQLDRLSRITDRIYVHVDMDVLDSREIGRAVRGLQARERGG